MTSCFILYFSPPLSNSCVTTTNTTTRSKHADVAVPLCVLLHPAVQLAVPDLYPMSIWYRSLLALNDSRMAKWKTKLSIQYHKTTFLDSTIAAIKKWHYMVANYWMLWALKNVLNTDRAFQFIFYQKKNRKRMENFLKMSENKVMSRPRQLTC